MRRTDREIKEFDEIVAVMRKCEVCHLALHDEEYPYLIPLNFGLQVKAHEVTLYFHGAMEGTKYELIAKNQNVSFAMNCAHRLVTKEDSAQTTMEYESVIGQGIIEIVSEEERCAGLKIIMEQYTKTPDTSISPRMIPHVNVMKLRVLRMTGKRNPA